MSQFVTDFVDPIGLTPAVYVKKDRDVFLFDCGRAEYPSKLTHRLKHIFISHAHVDHLINFDDLLIMQLHAPESQLNIYGPKGITKQIMHKINAYTWNLVGPEAIQLDVYEMDADEMFHTTFAVNGNMEGERVETRTIQDNNILTGDGYTVKRIYLNHGIPSVGYCFEENEKHNMRTELMQEMGFKGGPWVRHVKQAWETGNHRQIEMEGKTYTTRELADLIEVNRGMKIVYVTDFLWDEPTRKSLPEFASEADILYCEAAYKDEDIALAQKNMHMTDSHAEELARLSGAKKLIKFHRSDRYG